MQFAAAILVDQSGRLLLQLRDGNTHIDPHKWCLPGGSIDEGEEPMRAAHRELLEETGLKVEKLSLFWHGLGPSAAFPGAIGEFSVFYSATAATQDDVVCGEGAAMRFIDAAEVPKLEFGEMYTKIVSEFLTSPQYQSLSGQTTTANVRRAVRAIVLDEDDRILLCRFVFPHPAVPAQAEGVWAAPGGGIEPGEDRLMALRRELREETGLTITEDPPHVWHQEIAAVDRAPGLINDYYLVRTSHFQPRGELTDDQLAADENLAAFRWWQLSEIVSYTGRDLFSPRDLATPLTALLTGTPTRPVQLGL